jgi:hypothetical protein
MPNDTDILVVDDDPLLRLGIVSMLQDLGYRARAAQDPMRALPMVHQGFGVDLLITDYNMPGMTGVELAHRMAQERPGLLVLIMTGHQQLEDDLDPGWRKLTKPFTEAELRREIESMTSS